MEQAAQPPARRQNSQNQLATVGDKNTLKGLLKEMEESIKDVIPRHLTVDRVLKQVLIAHSRQPKLYECTRASFTKEFIKAAELGLDCSGTLGRAWLVPFYNGKIRAFEAVLIPGYQGLIDLARRGGEISSIEAHCVYEHDKFVYQLGTDQKLEHVPLLRGDRGEIIAVWALAVLKDGAKQLEVMTRGEIDFVRETSKAKDGGPWVTHYSEMARKTVIRRICKYLPLSPEMEKAIQYDDEATGIKTVECEAVTVRRGNAGLAEELAERRASFQPPAEPPPSAEQPQQAEPQPEAPPAPPVDEAPTPSQAVTPAGELFGKGEENPPRRTTRTPDAFR